MEVVSGVIWVVQVVQVVQDFSLGTLLSDAYS